MAGMKGFGKSVGWRALESFSAEGLAFLWFVLISRLLPVEAFGLMAICTSVLIIFQSQLQHGIPEALIQQADLVPGQARAALRASVLAGLVLAVGLLALAWPLSLVLGKPEIGPVLALLAPVLLCSSVSAPLSALVRRRMAFNQLAIRTTVATLAAGALAAAWAWGHRDVTALVLQQWSTSAIGLLVLLGFSRLPVGRADPPASVLHSMRPMVRSVRLTELANNLARRMDAVVLGAFLTGHDVGLYFLATRLVLSAALVTQLTLCEVGLALLSRLQHDVQAHRAVVLRMLRLMALACAAVFGTLGLVAPAAVPLVFGVAWQQAVPTLQVLTLGAPFAALSMLGVSALLSRGEPGWAARLSIGASLLQLSAVLVTARAGLDAVAWAVGAAQLAACAATSLALHRLLGVAAGSQCRAVLPVLGWAVASGTFAAGLPSGDALACAVRGSVYLGLLGAGGALLFRRELLQAWRLRSRSTLQVRG